MEMLIGSPRVIGFKHTLREFKAPVQVYTAQNRPAGMTLQTQPEALKMKIKYSSEFIDLGTFEYTFGKEEGEQGFVTVDELFVKAGIDPDALWQQVFDSIRELFPALADPPAGAETVGIRFYPKLEIVEAELDKVTTMVIRFYVAVYSEPEYENIVNMIQIEFQDQQTYDQRPVAIAQMEKANLVADQFIAGEHPNQANMDAEALAESKAIAAQEKRQRLVQIDLAKKALVGPLSAVLQNVSVQGAFQEMTRAVFTELKAKVPSHADWNIDTLMSFFPAAMEEVANS